MSLSVVIVAGGSGARFGLKKQFIELAGVPVLKRAVEGFDARESVDRIVVVVPEDDLLPAKEMLSGMTKDLVVTKGGRTRQESVFNGLKLARESTVVLIHDGVRPLVSPDLVARVIDGLKGVSGCIPALEVTDTLKEVREGMVARTIPRGGLYQVQTPQAFLTTALIAAHEQAMRTGPPDLTDDSAILEASGGTVRIVEGDPLNVKITFRNDILLAEAILACRTV
ncbi:MAG: 2-C-methyl-D-erythritol 4-phosphate cytidylyltransferase [Syntrophaceae bacterium]|nr:2-C-methyl-D-erythritol 4-phosphate cytidylyltransferase [Deltaproteobacteria bacterium]